MISIAVQKFLSLIRSHLLSLAVISFALGSWFKKILLQCMSEDILSMFSSWSSMDSWIIFNVLNHFDLICLYVEREYSNFIDLHAATCNISCWRNCIFSLPFLFYCSVIDLQCCVNFCCTGNLFNYTYILMLLNCGVGEDSWEFHGLQGDPSSPS